MPQLKPFNLFVYGTLKTPSVFRAVLGKRLVPSPGDADTDAFFPREAVLNGYKKVSPDHTYLYAVPDPQGRIRGLLVGPLPGECLAALRKYEGRNYSRRMLRVQTSDGPQQAIVFVGNLQQCLDRAAHLERVVRACSSHFTGHDEHVLAAQRLAKFELSTDVVNGVLARDGRRAGQIILMAEHPADSRRGNAVVGQKRGGLFRIVTQIGCVTIAVQLDVLDARPGQPGQRLRQRLGAKAPVAP